MAPGPVAIFDLDRSMAELRPDAACVVQDIKTFQDVRDALATPGAWDGVKTIIIDSFTALQDLAEAHVIKNVKTEKGATVSSIEGYGFGKGYRHLYDALLLALADLETHLRAGRNVILVMHDQTVTVPSPEGEDWLRYQPRLFSTKAAKFDERVREWLSYLFFVGYDIKVEDKVGKGHGTRTITTREMPHCIAKRRTELPDSLQYVQNDPKIWDLVFKTDTDKGETT